MSQSEIDRTQGKGNLSSQKKSPFSLVTKGTFFTLQTGAGTFFRTSFFFAFCARRKWRTTKKGAFLCEDSCWFPCGVEGGT